MQNKPHRSVATGATGERRYRAPLGLAAAFIGALVLLAAWALLPSTTTGLTPGVALAETASKVLVGPGNGDHGQFKVRPRHIYLTQALGGTLTLRWTSYHHSRATATATSRSSNTSGTVTTHGLHVTAYAPQDGNYFEMRITWPSSSSHARTEHLELRTDDFGPVWEQTSN